MWARLPVLPKQKQKQKQKRTKRKTNKKTHVTPPNEPAPNMPSLLLPDFEWFESYYPKMHTFHFSTC